MLGKQFRLSARACLNPGQWPAAAAVWNPRNVEENYFTHQPLRTRGRPQVRWDDHLRKFGEMQQQDQSMHARSTATCCSFENEYIQICREAFPTFAV